MTRLVVLKMMLAADRRSVGIALLVAAILPLGDICDYGGGAASSMISANPFQQAR
jgi:hypothetical protein